MKNNRIKNRLHYAGVINEALIIDIDTQLKTISNLMQKFNQYNNDGDLKNIAAITDELVNKNGRFY